MSSGHYGDTKYNGRYKMHGDTILLVTGSEEISGIKNEPFLLDRDSFLIELNLYYDYIIGSSNSTWKFYNSRKRYDILKKVNPDSLIILTHPQFDSLVRKCFEILKNYPVARIYDEDNLKIIRVYNTITFSTDTTFQTGIYANFKKLLQEKEYSKTLAIYYDWIPNKGMGYYFEQLQVELGGSPHMYSMYTIK
jgi:hypothetical protein